MLLDEERSCVGGNGGDDDVGASQRERKPGIWDGAEGLR